MIPLITLALTWLGRIGLAAFAVNEFRKLTKPQKDTIDQAKNQANAAGVSDDEIKQLAAATTYEQVEQSGKSPDDFWQGLSPAEQEALKFSPQSLRNSMQRTSFLGLAQTILWVSAGVAAGIAGFKGVPILLSTLAKLSTARKAGASALSLLTIIEEGKIAGIAKVWVPGLIAGIASAGGWLTGSMANNLNDALLWGRVFLDQAHSDVEKAEQRRKDAEARAAGGLRPDEPKTRITMAKTAKPQLFLGTIFTQRIGDPKVFERVLDDKITDANDLRADSQANLNLWLKSLPGRLQYRINIQNNPFDEFGVRLPGTWITMSISLMTLGGKIVFLDTIPLGPVEPQVYSPKTQEVQTIQVELPKLLTAEEISEVKFPATGLKLVDKTGNIVPVEFTGAMPSAMAETPTTPALSSFAEFAKSKGFQINQQTGEVINPSIELTAQWTRRLAGVKEPEPTPTPVPPPATTPAPTPSSQARPGIIRASVKLTALPHLNIRESAGVKGRDIGDLKPGTRVDAVESFTTFLDGFTWQKVRVFDTGQIGYVALEFLS